MKIEVVAFPRTEQGTGASRRLRRGGRVPGVLYGAGKSVQAIELDHNALVQHLKMEAFHASILDMKLGAESDRVLLRDYQMHPFRQQVLHVDFQRIAKDRKIHMKVPLHFKNAELAPGVKLGGGALSHVMNEVEISCLPDDLPEFIEVDQSKMEVGDTLHVNDLALPKGVELLGRLKIDNPPIVTIQVPRAAAAEETETAAPATQITTEKAADGAAGDKKAAQAALRAAQPEIQRGAGARVVAPNAAARRVSRLNARIKAMS